MKKFFAALLSLTSVFILSACLGGSGGAAVEVNIPDAFPEEEVEIVMWHAFGDDNQNLINNMLEDFLADNPNVSLRQVGQGNYDDLRSATIQANVSGDTPTLVMGYPDHFVEYLEGNALVPLDEYIDHDTFGVDIEDYNDAFISENRQYLDGFQYSMPLAKSTEMLVYNRDFFDYYDIEFSLDEPITWQQLEQMVEDHDMLGEGENQVEHLFNYDSESNLFINSSSQWEAGYTNIEGEVLIDNDNTRDMMAYLKQMMDDNILALPIEWDTAYGSAAFIDGDVAMTQGSTAGTRYNLPNNPDGKFGVFNYGVMPAIQNADGPNSAIQQGPNIAIMANSTDEERLVAWEIIKELTTPENTAYFSMNTGYVPVRDSAYDLQEYQDFLAIAEDTDNEDHPDYPYALANRVAQAQADWFAYEPPFTGRVSSSNARQEVGFLIEALYTGSSVEEALEDALADLIR